MFLSSAAPAAAQEGQGHPSAPGTRGSEGARPQGHHKPQRCQWGGSTPRPPEHVGAIPQLRHDPEPPNQPFGEQQHPTAPTLSLGCSRLKKDPPMFQVHPTERSGPWDVPAQLRPHTPPMSRSPAVPAGPSMPPGAPVSPWSPFPLTGPPQPARAPQHRPQPQQRHPRATRAARPRACAALPRGTPGARVPPRRTTAPMVQRGRALRPLAAAAAPTGWAGTSTEPRTRRRLREVAEPGENGGARLTCASPARARRVSGRATDGRHRPQVLSHSSPAPSASPRTLCPRRSSRAHPSRLTADTGVYRARGGGRVTAGSDPGQPSGRRFMNGRHRPGPRPAHSPPPPRPGRPSRPLAPSGPVAGRRRGHGPWPVARLSPAARSHEARGPRRHRRLPGRGTGRAGGTGAGAGQCHRDRPAAPAQLRAPGGRRALAAALLRHPLLPAHRRRRRRGGNALEGAAGQ